MSNNTTSSTDPSFSSDCPELQEELGFLYQRINFEKTTTVPYPRHFKLESMRRLLADLGEPQKQYAIIHVAGTKGKGSVARLISNALNETGIKTGVYSSPHIETIRERITVGGRLIQELELTNVLRHVREAVQQLDARADCEGFRKNSFFEIITASAMLHFANENVQRVVLEVGLGGRLDSTNVCEPELCVVTNISLDHTRQLGESVDLIAREKAGIIKRGVPVVSGVLDPLAAKEIREAAAVNNSELVELGTDFHVRISPPDGAQGSTTFDSHGYLPNRPPYQMRQIKLNGAGQHQAVNAAIAIAVLKMVSRTTPVAESDIRKSMAKFEIIGRGELLSREPVVIVDMAHNVASVNALKQMIEALDSPNVFRRTLVFGASRDKDLEGMLKLLLPLFNDVIFTRFIENPRAADPVVLIEIAKRLKASNDSQLDELAFSVAMNPQSAMNAIKDRVSDSSELICVAGSAFLVAETRPALQKYLLDQ